MYALLYRMVRVAILAYPGCSGAQVLGLYDSLRLANRVSVMVLGRDPIFDARVVGVSGRSARAAGGVRIGLVKPSSRTDILVVPGFALADDGTKEILGKLGAQARFIAQTFRRGVHVAGVCVGSFLLGEAGLLEGRRATTAWMFASEFAGRYPTARVDPRAILIEDGGITTTGGFSVVFDLALHLIRKTGGAELATTFGKFAMLDTGRLSQEPFTDTALLAASRGAFAMAIKHWLDARLQEPFQLARLARAFAVSPRTLQRRFLVEAGETPLAYLQRARIDAAKALLASTTLSVESITQRIGYQNVSAFARLFGREVGQSPGQYRRARAGSPRSEASGLS